MPLAEMKARDQARLESIRNRNQMGRLKRMGFDPRLLGSGVPAEEILRTKKEDIPYHPVLGPASQQMATTDANAVAAHFDADSASSEAATKAQEHAEKRNKILYRIFSSVQDEESFNQAMLATRASGISTDGLPNQYHPDVVARMTDALRKSAGAKGGEIPSKADLDAMSLSVFGSRVSDKSDSYEFSLDKEKRLYVTMLAAEAADLRAQDITLDFVASRDMAKKKLGEFDEFKKQLGGSEQEAAGFWDRYFGKKTPTQGLEQYKQVGHSKDGVPVYMKPDGTLVTKKK